MKTKIDTVINSGAPILIWGPPGVGKTASVYSLRYHGYHVETIIASIREPSDFSGLPILSDGGVRFAPPEWAVRLSTAVGKAVLFIDEISTAPPAVQAALLRVVLDRAVGDLQLPPTVSIVAAANPPEIAAGGWEISPPLANRFIHLDWELDVEGWIAEFPIYWGNPPQHPCPEEWARCRAIVAAFIRHRPNLLFDFPPSESQRQRGWPSPRSWDHASRAMACVIHAGRSFTDALPYVAGAVGEGAAAEFVAWVSELDLPNIQDVLQNPHILPDRADRLYAVLSALAQYVVARADIETYNKAWAVIDHACDRAIDIAAVAARQLIKIGRERRWATPPTIRRFAALVRETNENH